MDTSTGMIAVIVDDGNASSDQLRALVAYVRTAPEVVRAVVASGRAEAIRETVAPAHVFEAPASELRMPPPFSLLSRISDWSKRLDGEVVRLIVTLNPKHPMTDPWIIYECLQRLITNALADGIVAVRKIGSGPAWQQDEEWVRPADSGGTLFEDPSLYVFRIEFVRDNPENWRAGGQFLPYEISPIRH